MQGGNVVKMSIFKPNAKRPAPVFTEVNGVINVEGDLNLSDRGITELPGKFGKVTGHCLLSGNKLKSLKGCPEVVGGGFYCYNNKLVSLEGCPKEVGGDFSSGHNTVEFTIEQVAELCNVKGAIYE